MESLSKLSSFTALTLVVRMTGSHPACRKILLHQYPQENQLILERSLDNRPFKQEAQLMLTNPHDAFRGQSRLPNVVPFDMLGMASY